MVKKVQWEEHIGRERRKLFKNNPEYDDGIQEDIGNRIERLNDELKVRQESIDLLLGRLTNQITGIKETISDMLGKHLISWKDWKIV